MRTTGILLCLAFSLTWTEISAALEPNEIMVIANTDNATSVRLARYYCEKRGVRSNNVIPVSLGASLRDTIGRADYDQRLAGPIRRVFTTRKDLENIKCLVTTYGIPFRVGRRDPLGGFDAQLRQLQQLQQQEKDAVAQLKEQGLAGSPEHADRTRRIAQIQLDIDRIMGVETDAAVDSELSMLLCAGYDLYRWQPNLLYGVPAAGGDPSRTSARREPLGRTTSAVEPGRPSYKTLMVCRLDGPNYSIAKGLVDKAMAAEANGLAGSACIDSRGIVSNDLYGQYDQSLRDLALLAGIRTRLPVKEEKTEALFPPGSCPRTALYCGWYSLKHYIPAFDFVDGAIGFHIASFEAADLRNPDSPEWCPAMLMAGITATLGPVTEPYLHAFPQPKVFFSELFDGSCLVEAFYRTSPFNSWQLMLIGDPLYKPFKKN